MADRSNRRAAGDRRVGSGRADITYGTRTTIVGASGSGKSTLLRGLIRRFERAVMIDTKGEGAGLPDWHRSVGLAELRRDFPAKHSRVLVQRAPYDDEVAWFDGVCRYLYRVGAVAIGIDDLPIDLSSGRARSPGLEELYKLGRSRGVTPIGCVQRAKWIPLVMLSEATNLFIFRLQLEEDRQRIRGVVGEFPFPPRSEHGFIFARPGGLTPPIECRPLSV